MTGTDVARFTHKQSRSYLNHLVLTPNGQFWVVPLLHSVSDIKLAFIAKWFNKLSYKFKSTPTYIQSYEIKF